MVTGPSGSVSSDMIRAVKIVPQRRATRHIPLGSIVVVAEKHRTTRS